MKSPFKSDRYEHGSSPSFYLPKQYFILEEEKPFYLIGSRGSGKTTLLKALNWYERINNDSLKKQLRESPFENLFIGSYIKSPLFQFQSLDKWLIKFNDNLRAKITSLYIEMIFLESITHTISEMLAQGTLEIDYDAELEIIKESQLILKDYFPKLESKYSSFTDLTSILKEYRIKIDNYANYDDEITGFRENFNLPQIGVFSSRISEIIASFCENEERYGKGKWHFKVCLDECETFSDFQQLVVNSIVRVAKTPLIPIFSYVSRPKNITNCLLPNLTLQKADRYLLELDSLTPNEFKELAEGVATVRCQTSLNDDEIKFDTYSILGSLDINEIIRSKVVRSEGEFAIQLKNLAKDFANQVPTTEKTTKPYYQAYLANKLKLDTAKLLSEKKRKQESAEYRKKMVAAFLSICRDLRLRDVPYASADMVLNICDNCVRDYLSQLNSIFLESELDLDEFLKTEINLETQIIAIRKASEKKSESIPVSGAIYPIEIGKIIKGFALLTGTLQSGKYDKSLSHLKSTEKGWFKIKTSGANDKRIDYAYKLIRDATEAGFLKVRIADNEITTFRVHTSISPTYGFSYRGAYYEVPIDISDYYKILNAKESDLKTITNSIAKKILSDSHSITLFDDED